MGRASSRLFRLARNVRDAEVLFSGSPKKVARRVTNKIIGRRGVSKIWR